MGSLEVGTNVIYGRQDRGRFLGRIHDGARRGLKESADEGARIARLLATKKTGRMAGTITSGSGTSGAYWSVGTSYWATQEFGTRPHDITGWVRFYWAREGRSWTPGPNTIHHPGNRAVHFMRDSFEQVRPMIMPNIRRNIA